MPPAHSSPTFPVGETVCCCGRAKSVRKGGRVLDPGARISVMILECEGICPLARSRSFSLTSRARPGCFARSGPRAMRPRSTTTAAFAGPVLAKGTGVGWRSTCRATRLRRLPSTDGALAAAASAQDKAPRRADPRANRRPTGEVFFYGLRRRRRGTASCGADRRGGPRRPGGRLEADAGSGSRQHHRPR